MNIDLLNNRLQELFGFSGFRPHQEEAVRASLSGRNVLVVMPTGSGKSLCFQLPALMTSGLTVVVSPLIALIQDQADALNRDNVRADLGIASLTSMQSPEQQRDVLYRLRAGRLRMIYVAPERFRSGAFLESLRGAAVTRLVVDEAHCISEWGHDFRPDYLSLRPIVVSLGSPPVTALTATATRRVQKGIVDNLALSDPVILVGGFDRPNLYWSVHRCASDQDRREKLVRALPKLAAGNGSGLIYAPTRKACEEVGAIAGNVLAGMGKRAMIYHAGLNPQERNDAQAAWLAGDAHLLVATNAFGMGIDKSDVRYIVHYGYPESIESYYQEAGRAGRDGGRSRCDVLSCFTDRKTRLWLIENDALTVRDVESVYRFLRASKAGDERTIDKAILFRSLDLNLTKLRLAVARLEGASLVQSFTETSEELRFTLGAETWRPRVAGLIEEGLRAQKAERLRRLGEMIDYCKTENCRRRTILDYFGDVEAPIGRGPCCDSCDRPARPPAAAMPATGPRVVMPARIEPGSVHDIIQAIDALRPSLGKKRLSLLLRGSASKLGTDSASPLFGVLKAASVKQVDTFLDQLMMWGLLRQGGEDEYFVYKVTAEGRKAWQERAPLDVSVPGHFAVARSVIAVGASMPYDEDLFERLRNWRRKRAAELVVPPFFIMSDKILRAIAALKPETALALLEIPGIGDAKLAQYGNDVIEVVRDGAGNNNNLDD